MIGTAVSDCSAYSHKTFSVQARISQLVFLFTHPKVSAMCVSVCVFVHVPSGLVLIAMETEVAGWGQAQRGTELRLTVTVTLGRGE